MHDMGGGIMHHTGNKDGGGGIASKIREGLVMHYIIHKEDGSDALHLKSMRTG